MQALVGLALVAAPLTVTDGSEARGAGTVAAVSVVALTISSASTMAVSADGRVVAGLTANDPNRPYSVIDRVTGAEVHETTFDVMSADGGHLATPTGVRVPGGAEIALPALPDFYLADRVVDISADGRTVVTEAFDNSKGASTSFVRTLGGDVMNLDGDVPGANLSWGAHGAAVSADGRYASYVHTDFLGGCTVAGPFCVFEVRRRDLGDGSVVAVSRTAAGTESNGLESRTSISDDGRFVAFLSDATDLVASATTSAVRLYRRDVETGQTVLVAGDVELNALPFLYSMSGDGNRFAYAATSAVSPWSVVRVVDLAAGTNIALVDQDTSSAPACQERPVMSGNGSAVMFHPCSNGLIVRPTGATSPSSTVLAMLQGAASELAYTGTTPSRLFDSREGEVDSTPNLAAGATVTVAILGSGPPPKGAVLDVTVTNPDAAGFVTVWPCDQPRPTASNLNYTAGQTISNAVVAAVGADGTVCVYTQAAADLIVDVSGSFGSTSTFGAGAPRRVLDTRTDEHPATPPSVAAGSVTVLDVVTVGDLPGGAGAVTLNVTVTKAAAAGFVTVYPCGPDRPTASNLNYVAGQTIPNAVITPVAADGTICLYTHSAADLVVDLNGYFPATNSYTGVTPERLYDSRAGETDPVGNLQAGAVAVVPVLGPHGERTAVLNVTVTNPARAGFVTVYPCDTERPTTSNLNYAAGQTIANLVVSALSVDGLACIYTHQPADLIVDVNGYMTA